MNRRWSPSAGVCAAAGVVLCLGVWTFLVYAAHATREPPNYTLVEDGLYIGGLVPSPPPGTTAVLNLSESPDAFQAEVHAWEPIPDAEPAPPLDWLCKQVAFVATQWDAGRTTFVHCRAGVSRSGIVVLAYLMARHGWSVQQALTYLRSKRQIVNPNPAFRPLLAEWEQECARAGRLPAPAVK